MEEFDTKKYSTVLHGDESKFNRKSQRIQQVQKVSKMLNMGLNRSLIVEKELQNW
jgi:hypothetical protein